MNKKLISVDLRAQFGFLKKPDINEGIYLTYNCLHKPALLGILGAIIGLGGYAQSYEKDKHSFPEYYQKLKTLKVGIQPLDSAKGNFQKTVISYNNSVGYANLDGGTLIVAEQTLIKPSYKIFLLLDTNNKDENLLYENLKHNETVFIPYLGKNDFQLWWENYNEYDYENNYKPNDNYKVDTIFIKKKPVKDYRVNSSSAWFDMMKGFIYFENLPIEFDENIKHYRLENFAYSDGKINKNYVIDDLFLLKPDQLIVQLF